MRCQPSLLLPATLWLAHLATAQAPTRLEGLVLDPLSQRVANARLTAELDGAVLAETRSDASGTFVFAGLPERVLRIRATTAAPDVGAAEIDLAAQPRGFALLRTMPARRVHGTVRGANGEPVAGAWVGCTPLTAPAFALAASWATTDARGRYELTHVPFGRVAWRTWTAERPGLATTVEGEADTQQDVTLPDEDPAERGVQVVDATAAQQATVHIEVTATSAEIALLLPPALRHPARGEDGVFRVRGWPRDDAITARLRSAAFALDPTTVRVDAGLPDRTKRAYVVEDGEAAIVHGRLTSTDGSPVGGVRLSVAGGGSALRVETAADGSFSFPSPVAPGEAFALRCLDPQLVLHATTERFQFREVSPDPRLHLQHSPRKAHTIEVRAAHAVLARLEDARGAPVVGAEVRLLGAPRQQVSGGRVGGKTMVYTQAKVLGMVRSGLDGSVELRGLDLDSDTDLILQAIGPGWFTQTPFALVDPVEDLGTIRLRPAGALAGRVVLAGDQPSPGTHLRIENPADCWREVFAACDRSGAFLVTDLLPGPCRTSLVDQPRRETIDTAVAGRTIDVALVR